MNVSDNISVLKFKKSSIIISIILSFYNLKGCHTLIYLFPLTLII